MNANENKTSQPTPEQLLKMLDVHLNMLRSKRAEKGNRTGIRVASIMLVLTLAGVALFFLMTMLEDAHTYRTSNPQRTTEAASR